MNNKGFFFEEKKEKKVKKKKEIDSCEKCGLYNNCINPKMKYSGNGKKEILVIGEAPGKEEDKQNIQFIGKSGQFLRKKFKNYNIDFQDDCWITNACICRPENNKTPTTAQINYCRKNLKETIDILKPKKILTFGSVALQSLIGNKINDIKINKFVGWHIPDQDYKCFIYPNWHPAYLLRNNDEVLHKKFDDYLKNALCYDKKFKEIKPKIYIDDNLSHLHLKTLNNFENIIISIDIETSGLKPQKQNHFIYTISITQGNMFTFAFKLTEKNKELFIKILENKNIKKIAHNLQFENKWIKEKLNCNVKGWIFDTQLSTHVLDNRSNITSLKFQVYVNFGIVGYEKEIEKYIKSQEKGGNEFNNIKEAPINELLTYNGYDTFFTMLLYKLHNKKLDSHLKKGNEFFLESNIEISNYSGIRFDYNQYKKNNNILTEKIDSLHNKIMNSKEISLLKNKENFNYNSDKQLRELLFDICKWKFKNETKTGLKSVNAEALSLFDKKLTNNILERRKLVKIRDTYLEQFRREAVKIGNDYFIFPNFSLNIPVTYRSSSQMPNFQNIPVREELAKKITRGCLIPREGNFLLELDGKQMEVGTGCCYHFDPVMIDYVTAGKDMHRDLAMQLFFRNKDTYTKYERYLGKNGFIFPEFYGSTARIYLDEHKKNGYGEITFNLWEAMNDETKEHISKHGINSIYDFQKHVEKIESDFWGRRFKVYSKWKFDNWKEYKKKGYVELYTGFRCTGIMGFNDVNNYMVQGTAYHIAQNVLNKTSRFLREKKFKSVMLGEIHDSGLMDIVPGEFDDIIEIIEKKIKEVQNEWKWIIVPLKFEYEKTEINGSWDTKKEIKI